MDSNLATFLIGLLLAIPLSVLANMWTPKVQEWWATTNQFRRELRIYSLKTDLTFIEEEVNPQFLHDRLTEGLRRLVLALILLIYFALMAIAVILSGPPRSSERIDAFARFIQQQYPAVVAFIKSYYEEIPGFFLSVGVGIVVGVLRIAFTKFKEASSSYWSKKRKRAEAELIKLGVETSSEAIS